MACPNHNTARRRWLPRFAVVLLVGAWAVSPPAAQAAVVRVEEDWEAGRRRSRSQLRLPADHLHDLAGGRYRVNPRRLRSQPAELPGVHAGGLQLQLWNGETAVAQITATERECSPPPARESIGRRASDSPESVCIFRVSGGTSTTWGAFGQRARYGFPCPRDCRAWMAMTRGSPCETAASAMRPTASSRWC